MKVYLMAIPLSKEYEADTDKFRYILDLEDGLVPQAYKRTGRLESPAIAVKAEVRR